MRSLRLLILLAGLALATSKASADTLTITYLDPNQTATVGEAGFATVTFFGSITNNSNAPVTFEMLGGPQPPSPYVAGFVSGVPFPGMTLGPGASTGVFALATVTINPFDPSLPYPGSVNIVFPALDAIGNTLGEGPLSIEVLNGVPEPSVLLQLLGALCALPLVVFFCTFRKKSGLPDVQKPLKSL
jgi:hypothetical protein